MRGHVVVLGDHGDVDVTQGLVDGHDEDLGLHVAGALRHDVEQRGQTLHDAPVLLHVRLDAGQGRDGWFKHILFMQKST